MSTHRHAALILGLLLVASAGAAPVETAEPGETVERHLSADQTFRQWSQDPALLEAERGEGWLARCVDDKRYLSLNKQFVETLAECLASLPPGPRLEVCAGSGELAEAIARHDVPITASDVDPPAGASVLSDSERMEVFFSVVQGTLADAAA